MFWSSLWYPRFALVTIIWINIQLFFKHCIIAFAFNAKSFAIAILAFFLLFPSCHFFWTDCQKPFSQRFIISYQESVWPRSDSFLERTRKTSRKNCSSSFIYDACGTWHGLCTVNSIHSIQKSTKNSQKFENKLVEVGRRFKDQKSSW